MAKSKKPKNSSINSSIRQNTADTNMGFAQLLEKQAESMEIFRNQLSLQNLQRDQAWMANKLQLDKLQQIGEVVGAGVMDARKRDEELKLEKLANEQKAREAAEIKKEIEARKQAIEMAKTLNKLRIDESKAIANMAKSMQTFETISDRISNMGKKLKDNFGSTSALKVTAMKALNIGGIFNKSIAKEKFIQTQRKLGSEDDRKTLAAKFETANRANIEIKKNEAEISALKKETGMSEEDLAKRGAGKHLFAKRQELTDTLAGADLRAANLKTTPTEQHAEAGADEERAIEAQKHAEKQDELLNKIEQNTRGDSPEQKLKPKEEKENDKGMLSGLLGGGKVGKALEGMKNFGIGLIAVAGALWIASKAFASFAEVEWDSVGKGLVALAALVGAAKVLDTMKGSLVKSAAVLGLMALATWGVSKAFGEFAELDWDTILKGFAAVAGLGVIGVILGKFVGAAIAGGVALAALGAGLWVVGKGMQEMGDAFNTFVEGIEKLSNIGFEGLAGVAGGMVLVGGALAAFAAGQIAAGLGTLISNLLTLGQDSPIEQLEKLGNLGPKLMQAANGINGIGKAMKAFAGVDKKQMDAINDFPWVRATAFVAAGGAMSVNGAQVYNQSKANADENAKANASKGGTTAIVNAPVNNTTRHNQIIKPQIRNQESTQSRYISSKYGIV